MNECRKRSCCTISSCKIQGALKQVMSCTVWRHPVDIATGDMDGDQRIVAHTMSTIRSRVWMMYLSSLQVYGINCAPVMLCYGIGCLFLSMQGLWVTSAVLAWVCTDRYRLTACGCSRVIGWPFWRSGVRLTVDNSQSESKHASPCYPLPTGLCFLSRHNLLSRNYPTIYGIWPETSRKETLQCGMRESFVPASEKQASGMRMT